MTGLLSKQKANGDAMFIYINKNCLSAYGKIYRRGAVVELDDEVGAALLGSDDFSMCDMDPIQQEAVKQGETAKDKAPKGAKGGKGKTITKGKSDKPADKPKEEPEEELPAPNPEEAVEK